MKISLKVDGIQETVKKLNSVGLTLKSPAAVREIQRGADLMAAGARNRAPVDTGDLRAGIYTISAVKSNFRPLRRARNGQSLNDPLDYPPKGSGVLIVNSVFYERFVQGGRSQRDYNPTRGIGRTKRGKLKTGRKASRAGVGKMRKRRFFTAGIRQARPAAMALMALRLERLVKTKWDQA